MQKEERKKEKNSREHRVVAERVPIPQILETLRCLHETHIRPLVVLPRHAVKLEEVRHRSLQELRLQAVACIVNHNDAGGSTDDRLFPGGVREYGGVHVTGLGGHLEKITRKKNREKEKGAETEEGLGGSINQYINTVVYYNNMI